MSEQPFISVIVPVYNVEDKLSRCVESVFAQTYPHWELILVDDGSPDNSGRLCDEYAAQDARVLVIHQDNAGVSAARNAGMAIAQGDWWTFVDSDDFITASFLEDFVSVLQVSPSLDLYFGDVIQQKLDGDVFVQYHHPQCLCSLCEAYKHYQMSVTGDATAKVFRSDIIRKHGVRFPQGIQYAEDHIFLISYLLHANNVFLSSKVCYIYYRAENSLSTTLHYDRAKEYRCVELMLPLAEGLAQRLALPLENILRESFATRLITASLYELSLREYCRYVQQLDSLMSRYWRKGVRILSGHPKGFMGSMLEQPFMQYYFLRLRVWAKNIWHRGMRPFKRRF